MSKLGGADGCKVLYGALCKEQPDPCFGGLDEARMFWGQGLLNFLFFNGNCNSLQ